MLVSLDLLEPVQNTIHIIGRWNVIPFYSPIQIPSQSNRLSAHSSKKLEKISGKIESVRFCVSQSYCKTQWMAHVIDLLLTTLFGFYQYSYESPKLADKVINVWKSGFYLIFLYFTWYYHKYSQILVKYLNGLVRFEARQEHDNVSGFKSKFFAFLVKNNLLAFSTHPIIFSIGAAIFPEASWRIVPIEVLNMLGLLGTSNENMNTFNLLVNFGKRFVSFMVSYITWKIIANVAILMVTLCSLVATFCLQAMIGVFNRKVCSDRSFGNSYKIYRQIEILCLLYNEFHRHSVQLVMVVLVPNVIAVSLYLLISSWTILDMTSKASFLIFLEMAFLVMMLNFRYASLVYVKSEAVKSTNCEGQFVKFLLQAGSRQLDKRYWKAIPILKCLFFERSFFDKTTSLAMLDFALNQAINLMLLEA